MVFHCFIATSLMFFHYFFWTTLEIIVAGLWNKPTCVIKFHFFQHLLFSWGICLSGIHVNLVLVLCTSHDEVFMKKLRAEWKTHSWRFSATQNCLKLQSPHQLVILFPYWNAYLLLHILRIIGVMLVFLGLLTKYSGVARQSPRCVMIDSIIFARPDSFCLLANSAFQKLCVASCWWAVRLHSRLTSEIHCCRASLLHDYWKLPSTRYSVLCLVTAPEEPVDTILS